MLLQFTGADGERRIITTGDLGITGPDEPVQDVLNLVSGDSQQVPDELAEKILIGDRRIKQVVLESDEAGESSEGSTDDADEVIEGPGDSSSAGDTTTEAPAQDKPKKKTKKG